MAKLELSADLRIRDVESGAAMTLQLDGLRGPDDGLAGIGEYVGRLVQERVDGILALDGNRSKLAESYARIAQLEAELGPPPKPRRRKLTPEV